MALIPARDQLAVIAAAAVNTATLSADQARAITAIAASPWLIQPLSAPAGAGKTTSLKELRAAAHRAGNRRVLALAPTGKAVDVAVREGAGYAGYTVAKALKDLRGGRLRFDQKTVVVVDEGGMVGTQHLRELLAATTRAGTKTVLVGDAHQLALVKDLPWAQRLSEVWRMCDPEERSASLALRHGGPKPVRRAIEWYRTHHGLHTGDSLTMAHDALANYQADIAAGKDALLMCDSWELSDALNKRIHTDTVAVGAPTVTAARGHRIGVGDIIISRDNDPTISVYDRTDITKPAAQVRNGHRWRVDAVDADNYHIAARRIGDDARAAFTGDYLRQHITHGYATTIHANQGATAGDELAAGTAHAVLGELRHPRPGLRGINPRQRRKPRLPLPDDRRRSRSRTQRDRRRCPCGAAWQQPRRRCPAARHHRPRRTRPTVMAVAADTDRAQLPQQVAELLKRHHRTRAQLRAHHRAHTRERGGYDLAAELPQLRAEIDFLNTAGRAWAPAASYQTPDETLTNLDEPTRMVVTHITTSYEAVHSLQLHPGSDKPAALAAIAAAAHHNNHRVLALPATGQAAQYAAEHRYADTTSSPDKARDNLQTGRWKLPLGSLVVVDDTDHLDPTLLQWFAERAATTNTNCCSSPPPMIENRPTP